MNKVTTTEVRNAALYMLGESIWIFQMYMVLPSTFLTMLLTSYGADKPMIGAISAIEGGAMIVTQVLGVYLFHSRRKRKRQLLAYHFAVILPLMGLLAVAAWPGVAVVPLARCWLLLGCFLLMILSIGVIIPVWNDWMGHLFRREIRGTVMGIAQCVGAVVGMAGGPTAAYFMNRWQGPETYAWLYALSFVIGVASITTFLFVKDEVDYAPETAPPTPRQMLQRFAHSLADLNFRRFMVGRVLGTLGFCIAPFIVLHYRSAAGGGLTNETILQCSAAQVGATALSVLVLGLLGDRRGHRIGVVAGAVAQWLGLGAALTFGGSASCIVVYACAGVSLAATTVSYTNILLETCPHDNRMAHLTVGSLVSALPATVGPLLAGQVAQMWGLQTIFYISLAVSAAATVWFALRTKEPRDLELSDNSEPPPVRVSQTRNIEQGTAEV